MVKRLTALLLLLALGAGVASGTPLHSGKKECDMGESMEMMDCCKRARAHGNTPEIQAARLCCALNCQNGGVNGPAAPASVWPPQVTPSHPAAVASAAPPVPPGERRHALISHTTESPPVYLLNLAFLI